MERVTQAYLRRRGGRRERDSKVSSRQAHAQDSAFVQQCSLTQLRRQLPLRWPTPVGLAGSPPKSYRSGYRYPSAEVCRDPGQVQASLDLGGFDLALRLVDLQRASAGAGAVLGLEVGAGLGTL